jgi:hypothetical protein
MNPSNYLPRVPKKVEGTSKYYFGWKGETKNDNDNEYNEVKQAQVETGRLAAHYLGEFENALEEYLDAKKNKSSNIKIQWPFVEKVLNMYMIYKISKDVYEALPDTRERIPEVSVEIQQPRKFFFGYTIREHKLNVLNKHISEFNPLLANTTPWIRKNLLLQYPIRAFKNDSKEPIVLKKIDVIACGSSTNPETYEFPNSVVKHYDILSKIITQFPQIVNTFTIQDSTILNARNGSYKLFEENSEDPSRRFPALKSCGGILLLGQQTTQPSTVVASSTQPSTSLNRNSSTTTTTTTTALQPFQGSQKPKLPNTKNLLKMAGQKENNSSSSNSNTNSTSSSSSSNTNSTSSTSSNSNSNTTVVQQGGKRKSYTKRIQHKKLKSKSKSKTKSHKSRSH